MNPQFTRPENPVPFTGREELCGFLDQHFIPYMTWERGVLDKLWEEIVDGDTLITHERIPGTDIDAVFRNIRTITIRVTHEVAAAAVPGNTDIEVLTEYAIRNGARVPRKHTSSSVSEKLHWRTPGSEEQPPSAIKRVLKEEMGVSIADEDMDPERLFRIKPEHRMLMMSFVPTSQHQESNLTYRYYEPDLEKHLARGIELEVRESQKFQGMLVRNQLAHYIWKMPNRYYRPEGYVDQKTRYESVWVYPTGLPSAA